MAARLVAQFHALRQEQRDREQREKALIAKRRLLYPDGIPAQPLLKDYAEHLGHVILIAAEVDTVLSALGGQLVSGSHAIDLSVWGESGKSLVDALVKVGAGRPDVLNLARRYEALYDRRNQLVHSIRPTREGPDAYVESVRPRRRQKGIRAQTAMPAHIERITVPDLVQAYFDWQDLRNDAVQLLSTLRERDD